MDEKIEIRQETPEVQETPAAPGEQEAPKKKKKRKSRFAIAPAALAIVLALTLGIGFVGGYVSYKYMSLDDYTLVKKADLRVLDYMYNKYSKLEDLCRLIDAKYYKEIDDDTMLEGAYRGVFASTGDPYTAYYNEQEFESLVSSTGGEFFGVGIKMSINGDNEIVIISIIPDSPAEAAGIKPGDIILAVDGTPYNGDSMDIAASNMRGEKNTYVTITIKSGTQISDKTLLRQKIVSKTVSSSVIDGNIGYIKISEFELATDEDFKTELRNMELNEVNGLIIDLRDNGGGIVDSALNIADMLLPEGTIMYTEDKNGSRIYSNSSPDCTQLPFVILVNGATASASEILTAAVQDSGVGKIIGTKTFGKGIIQESNGFTDNTGYKMTVRQYFSPDGHAIHGVGITPDIVIHQSPEVTTDIQLEKAREVLTK